MPYICDTGCSRLVGEAIFAFYHFTTGSLLGVLLICGLYKLLK